MSRITSLLCGALVLCAQPSFAQGFGFGAKGGVNIATEEAVSYTHLTLPTNREV